MVCGLLSNVKNQTILLTLKNISHPEPEYFILQSLKAGVLNVLKIGEGIFETALISFIVFFPVQFNGRHLVSVHSFCIVILGKAEISRFREYKNSKIPLPDLFYCMLFE